MLLVLLRRMFQRPMLGVHIAAEGRDREHTVSSCQRCLVLPEDSLDDRVRGRLRRCPRNLVRFLLPSCLLLAHAASGQMSYTFPEQRSASLNVFANAGVGDSANHSQSATPFQTFTVAFADQAQDSFNGSSAQAQGGVSQTSSLSPTVISSANTANWSASFVSTYPQSAQARVAASSDAHITFILDQYCRYTLTAQASANVSANVTELGAGNSMSSMTAGIGLGDIRGKSYATLSIDAQAGYGNAGESPSQSKSLTGYLPGGIYSLTNGLHANAQVQYYANASTGGTAETQATLVVEPMGTRLVGLEVVQAIQDWNNSVPLIAGKPTYVRAHIDPISAPAVPVMNARLRAFVEGLNGAELTGSPITPLPNSAKTILPGAANADRRADIQHSVNFELPPAWTNSNIRLVLEMDGLVSGDASLQLSIGFAPSPQLDLHMVSVSLVDGAHEISAPPSGMDIARELDRLVELYPLTRQALRTTSQSLVIQGNVQLSAQQFLEQFKLLQWRGDPAVVYVAALSGNLSGSYSGISDRIPGNIVSARIDDPDTLAHEVAHALGEYHPINRDIFDQPFIPSEPDWAYGPDMVYDAGPSCGIYTLAAPQGRAVDFPFWGETGLYDIALIGPLDEGDRKRVYGLANASQPGAIQAVSPFKVVDLMMGSYCGNYRNWISTHTYGRLRAAMQARTPSPRPPGIKSSAALPYVAVRGLVDFGSNSVSLLPFVPLALSSPPMTPLGSTHLLEIHCRVGTVSHLDKLIPFTPDVPRKEGATGAAQGFFTLPVACNSGELARVDVKRNGMVLASRSRSANPPAIVLSSPSGAEILDDDPITVSWLSSDADGDPLSHEIQLSTDGGQAWQTLAVDWTGGEFRLVHDMLPSSQDARVRVLASDGFNSTASSPSAAFIVANHPPKVLIASPTAGDFLVGDDLLAMNAIISDRDGIVPDAGITWASNVDGFLGNGAQVSLPASSLVEGRHTIRVTVIDVSGAVATAETQVMVSRTPASISFSLQPTDKAVSAGEDAVFTVAVEGDPTPALQWQRSTDAGFSWADLANDSHHAGVDTASLTVHATTLGQDGHRYRAIASNVSGSASSAGATLAVSAAQGAAQVSMTDVAILEGNTGQRTASITVNLDRTALAPVAFDIATASGSATAGSDFLALNLIAQVIPAGQASKTFEVTLLGDTQAEPDEMFSLLLSNVSGAVVADDSARITILTDDVPVPALSVQDAFVLEGHVGARPAVFAVNLSSPAPPGGVRFDFTTANARGGGRAALAGSDFAATSRTDVVIPEGQRGIGIPVKVFGDNRRESDEMFSLQLTNVVGATVADGAAIGTIVNDDALRLSSIQGAGLVSPLLGQPVVTQGIVTAVTRDGFFVQGTHDEQDDNPASSEGLFVRVADPLRGSLGVGQRVEVSGVVRERIDAPSSAALSRTELEANGVTPVAVQARPEAVLIDELTLLSQPGPGALEPYEGMRVLLPRLKVVGPSEGHLDETGGGAIANGVFHVVPAGMLRTFVEPGRHVLDMSAGHGVAGMPVFDGNPERLRIDSLGQRGARLLAADVGDSVTGLTGVLDDGLGSYGLLPDPDVSARLASASTPSPVVAVLPSEVSVGYLPLQRYFDDSDDPRYREPVLAGGAYALRLAKTAHVLCSYLRSPMILAVTGIEAGPALAELAAASNQRDGNLLFRDGCSHASDYRAVPGESQEDKGLGNGFLVDVAEIRPGLPRVQVLSTSKLAAAETFVDPLGRSMPLFERPPRLLRARLNKDAGKPLVLSVVVAEMDSADVGPAFVAARDDTGREEQSRRNRRLAQARYLARYVQAQQAARPDEKWVLLGGFGASEFSDGHDDLMAMLAGRMGSGDASGSAGTTSLLNMTPSLPAAERYSSVRDGNARADDHILVSASLARQHRLRCGFARINADFGIDHADDYSMPMRIAEHDPMVLYIDSR